VTGVFCGHRLDNSLLNSSAVIVRTVFHLGERCLTTKRSSGSSHSKTCHSYCHSGKTRRDQLIGWCTFNSFQKSGQDVRSTILSESEKFARRDRLTVSETISCLLVNDNKASLAVHVNEHYLKLTNCVAAGCGRHGMSPPARKKPT